MIRTRGAPEPRRRCQPVAQGEARRAPRHPGEALDDHGERHGHGQGDGAQVRGPDAQGQQAHEATGGWTLVLVLLALTSVPLTVAGVRVARPTYVDDEI